MQNRKLDYGDLNAPFRRFVADLLMRMGAEPATYCGEISPDDEMFFKAILPGFGNQVNMAYFRYIESALRMFDVYRQLVDALCGGFANVRSVLDFGSGYGRITRSLVQRLPRERIWVTDIYAGAMAWQQRLFGVNAVPSAADPDRFDLAEEFSLVFVGSVFSHLPDALFQRWLKRLYRLVAPDGLFVFSVHGEAILPPTEKMSREGIRYLTFSESASLGTDVYGMTYVSDAYVDASIARLDPARAVQFRRFRKGLYENQDLYVVAGADVDLGGFVLRIPPIGGFELMSGPADGEVMFYGWAIDLNEGHQITRFEVFHDERSVHVGVPVADLDRLWHYFPGAPNIPVRWQFSLPSGLRHPQCVIRVELRSSSGAVAYSYADIPDGESNPETMRGHLT